MMKDANSSEDETQSLSFSQRRALKVKHKKQKPKRRLKLQEKNQNEANQAIAEINTNVKSSSKFETISHRNELQIDASDVMSDVEFIKRKIEHVLNKTEKKKFQCSESYLQTSSLQFIQLLSKNNRLDDGGTNCDIYNPNMIMDESITLIVRNEMMRIFTWIVGIVEGVLFLSLFTVIHNSNHQFLQKFASLLWIIQFISYVVAMLLIPYAFILFNYKSIHKYQIGLFMFCALSIFICCMIEFPISDEIYYLYNQDAQYFTAEQNVNQMSLQLTRWKNTHIAKFCFLSLIWILCISLLRGTNTTPNETKKEE